MIVASATPRRAAPGQSTDVGQRGKAPDGDQPPGGPVAAQLPEDQCHGGAPAATSAIGVSQIMPPERAVRHARRVAVAERPGRGDRQAPGRQREPRPARSRRDRAAVAADREAPAALLRPARDDQPERESAGDREVEPEDRLPGRDA